jgi:AraC family ethanolamine operon transcriptional activator
MHPFRIRQFLPGQVSVVVDKNEQKNSIITCFDQSIDEYCDCLRKFDLRIKQLSRGLFRGHSTLITLQGITLIRRCAGARYASSGWLPGEAVFVFPVRGGEFYANGRFYGRCTQAATPGNKELHVIFPEEFDQLLVTVPFPILEQYLTEEEVDTFLKILARMESSQIDEVRKSRATRHLLDLFQRIEASPHYLCGPELEECCMNVIAILYEYLTCHQRCGNRKVANHEKILQRALHLVESNPTHFFNLDEIAKESFASKRSVQYAFTSLIGLSPMRYIKISRINDIRKELRTQGKTSNFTSIIAKYAFSNVGRMSREYTEFFGERPRDTLRSARGEPEQAGPPMRGSRPGGEKPDQ